MTTVIAFILMFGVLVSVHEWGHLIFAKRAGMLAREFAIGFGPKIFSFERNETLYTIRLLPIGGYVRVAGDDPEIIDLNPGHHIGLLFNEVGKVEKIIVNHKEKYPEAHLIEVTSSDLDHDLAIKGYNIGETDKIETFHVDEKAKFVHDEKETQIAPYDRQFASKTVGQRAMQLFAGPLMNFVLAILVFIIIGLVHGVPTDKALLGEVQADSPAEAAGLLADDEIIAVDGESISTWEAFTSYIQKRPEQAVNLTVDRGEEKVDLTMTPRKIQDPEGNEIGQAGVLLANERSFIKTFTWGFEQTYMTTKLIITNLFMLVTGQLSLDMLSGPVGIYDMTDQIVQTGFVNYLLWTAMLSINLGIINLVPLPALDGGRLLFVGIEAVRGKPIEPQKEGMVHVIGFLLLMILMIIVTWNDIQRLFM